MYFTDWKETKVTVKVPNRRAFWNFGHCYTRRNTVSSFQEHTLTVRPFVCSTVRT